MPAHDAHVCQNAVCLVCMLRDVLAVKRDLRILQEQLHRLRIENDRLLARRASSASAPMRTLFPELCDMIFAYCATGECDTHCASADDGDGDDARDCVAPLVLARVCRRWRHLVLNNPNLWTHIHARPCALDTRRVRLWLERSADLRLQVTICHDFLRYKHWDTDSINKVSEPLLLQFRGSLHRIQSFRMHLAFDILRALGGPDGHIHMPLLEQLDLLIEHPHGLLPLVGMLYAPKLTQLRVRDITLWRVFSEALLTTQSLTIETSHWKYSQLFPHLLSTCAQLQTCRIAFPNSLFFLSVQLIELPELLDLTLEWPYLFDPKLLFSALRAPKLHALRLVHQTRQLALRQGVLASLSPLAQSAPALREFTIEGCSLVSYSDAHALLSECRALERLTILHSLRSDRLLAPLTLPLDTPATSEWVCPRLTHVTLGALQAADARSIVSFARSRTANGATPAPPGGGVYLKELALETDVYNLPMRTKLLLLSGLMGVHDHLAIVGPISSFFRAQDRQRLDDIAEDAARFRIRV